MFTVASLAVVYRILKLIAYYRLFFLITDLFIKRYTRQYSGASNVTPYFAAIAFISPDCTISEATSVNA